MFNIFNRSSRREKLDDTPVVLPVRLRKSETVDDRIKRIVSHSLSRAAEKQGLETFEESMDFDIPDDPIDPATPWEVDHDLSAMQAVDHGLAERPKSLPPERLAELKKIKIPRKKHHEQLELENFIADQINKAMASYKPKDDPE